MNRFFILTALSLSLLTAGCNTVGGFGQDISEAGKALDSAAYWSQNQIQQLNGEENIATGSIDNTNQYNNPPQGYNNSGVYVQEPDTARRY